MSQQTQKYFVEFFSDEKKIFDLVTVLLIVPLTTQALNYLRFLSKLDVKNLSYTIQIKLLYTICKNLNKAIWPFTISDRVDSKTRKDISEFKSLCVKHVRSAQVVTTDEKTLCACLDCLSTFNFSDFSDQMGSFVKDTALSYLDDKSSTIRKAAAKAVALLSARRPKISQLLLSHNVMYEILEKLLTIAISDPDMEVREIMLGS